MDEEKPNIVVTGISGHLGLKLLPQLKGYRVTGIGLNPPETSEPLSFVRLDLGLEESCRELFLLMRALRPVAVIHLAFLSDPMRSGMNDADRTWQINVGGTARVFEALTEVNRDEEIIKKFIFVSCAYAYGTHFPHEVTEDKKLSADSLTIAVHKMEADQAIQQRAPSARGCSVYLLRPAIFAGVGGSNYLVRGFQGTPSGRSKIGTNLNKNGKRMPFIVPLGKKYLARRIQAVHIEDVARVITFILRKSEPESRRLTVLNIAGRGEPIALGRCAEIAETKLLRVPGEWMMRQLSRLLWRAGISEMPPEAIPYLSGNPIMNTDRLREFLGPYYEDVIHHTVADAFACSFASRRHLETVGSTAHTVDHV
ncbi:MAG TPA: NAD-dependent epimerase/dehydratase family protein [Terriglobales bacterium]|nr:NAD-dependent epimerase/dehydratase family protein [Terriglobales bacterium]